MVFGVLGFWGFGVQDFLFCFGVQDFLFLFWGGGGGSGSGFFGGLELSAFMGFGFGAWWIRHPRLLLGLANNIMDRIVLEDAESHPSVTNIGLRGS